MKKIYEKKIYALACFVFSQAEIALAKNQPDPLAYLAHNAAARGAFGHIEIFSGCYGYNISSGKVLAIGLDADKRIDFEHPVLTTTIQTLARSALAGMYQESFL